MVGRRADLDGSNLSSNRLAETRVCITVKPLFARSYLGTPQGPCGVFTKLLRLVLSS